MQVRYEATLVKRAIAEIEQLLHNYDHWGQIESALPLIHQHHRTLKALGHILLPSARIESIHRDKRWVDDLVTVYTQLGGKALDCDVYRAIKQLRQSEGRSWPRNARATIRQSRQAHNIESVQYRGGADLFRMVRPGLWRLKNYTV